MQHLASEGQETAITTTNQRSDRHRHAYPAGHQGHVRGMLGSIILEQVGLSPDTRRNAAPFLHFPSAALRRPAISSVSSSPFFPGQLTNGRMRPGWRRAVDEAWRRVGHGRAGAVRERCAGVEQAGHDRGLLRVLDCNMVDGDPEVLGASGRRQKSRMG